MQNIKVALGINVDLLFDYLTELDVKVGARVIVPFRNKDMVGVVFETNAKHECPQKKIKQVKKVLDDIPLLLKHDMDFILWASNYYHEPIGLVVMHAFPKLMRNINSDVEKNIAYINCELDKPKLSGKQKELYEWLAGFPKGSSKWQLLSAGFKEKTILALEKKAGIVKTNITINEPYTFQPGLVALNDMQDNAVNLITATPKHEVFLLDGITGSGKTEVYLEVIDKILAAGKKALILLPEIGLTPQILARFKRRFNTNIAVLNSELSDLERLSSWMQIILNEANIIIGTRLSIFTPIANLGVIVVDEEHDSSFKQQSGFRYMARDLAIVKAKMLDIKIILGSATPSLESYYNAKVGKYKKIQLASRAGSAKLPEVKLIDLRARKLRHGLSPDLITAITKHIAGSKQVLLFLNRRGYCPVILCHSCGWSAKCQNCDASYTYHKKNNYLFCHICNSKKAIMNNCEACNSSELLQVGFGTEKLEEQLSAIFPDTKITRADRDVINKNNTLSDVLRSAYAGDPQILLGTQMLAKGHDLPNLTLVGVIDADGALYSSDFRASEKLMQNIVQVSGRAGRSDYMGEVLIQTHLPDHRFFQAALSAKYTKYSEIALLERANSGMPPYGSLALLRVEASHAETAFNYLVKVRGLININDYTGVQILGPMSAPMPKKSGKYHAQLLIHGISKHKVHKFIKQLLLKINQQKYNNVKWSIDIDPQEML
jgi:primosomal protein N' (replication factor Y) (superfamily II helicase)